MVLPVVDFDDHPSMVRPGIIANPISIHLIALVVQWPAEYLPIRQFNKGF
jgi:hypothetical protein